MQRYYYFFIYLLWLVMALSIHDAQAAKKDTTPDPFFFTDQTNVALNTVVTSNTITVSGINASTSISVTGGQYSRNGGAFTSASGSVYNGDTVRVQQTSSSSYSMTTNTALTIGGVKDTFSVTTQTGSADITPDTFGFTAQTGVALNTAVASNAATITGINAPASVTVSGGSYSINGGAFTSAAGSLNNGDSVRVQLTSSSQYSTQTTATLTIGGVQGVFQVTTLADAGGFLLEPASGGDPNFTSTHFSGSGNCLMCHNNLTDAQGKDVSIETDWSSTMMANSARDPLWRAKVRSELNRNPQLADVISDKCTRCHAPMANFEAKKSGEPMQILDGGFLDASHSRHDSALNGVSCTLCHQIQDAPNLGTLSGFTGKYEIGSNKLIYGPYDNLTPNPMVMNTGYTPTYSAHVKESKLCASCHNLKTPYVDSFGNVLSTTPESEFPEQMPYSEWEHSSYATSNPQSCQQCHMSRANGVAISNRPMWLQTRDNFAVHDLVGANRLMLNIFKDNKTQLGVLSNNFPETIAKTEAMLQSAAAVTPASQSLINDTLDFTLRVNSNTGHKLPSAYPSRRVILHVTVKDNLGNVVFESGKVNADGSVTGVDADTDPAAFEPHHELITSPDQVQVYEAIMGDDMNQVTYTLLRGMTYLKDNRILPQGFDKATASSDIRVAGDALNDDNFIGGSDEIGYRIAGLNGASYQVTAELIHQPLAYGFAQDLFSDSGAEIQDFQKMFQASNAKSTTITTHAFSVSR
ncbi:autotransporter outer membrane beta-barrel domain-containing protein [Methylobacter luteus]|uniref:multiheme c-type cytochrome n=1 Tax=Methylobacter luteus TaxID=415 RepID=UPI0003FFC3B8|nr:multiheme c-type cytochrome [Methylobacter luteus]